MNQIEQAQEPSISPEAARNGLAPNKPEEAGRVSPSAPEPARTAQTPSLANSAEQVSKGVAAATEGRQQRERVIAIEDAPEIPQSQSNRAHPQSSNGIPPAGEKVQSATEPASLLTEHFERKGAHYRFRKNEDVIAFSEERSLRGQVIKTDHNGNDLVVKGMVELAIEKGWQTLEVSGTREFKQQVWLEATLRGRPVKGYAPTLEDMERLKERSEREGLSGNSIKAASEGHSLHSREEPGVTLKRVEYAKEVLEMGRAPYKHLAGEPESFYIKLTEGNGKTTTVWGKDLERAAHEIDLKVGDRVRSIERVGAKPVTVTANVRDSNQQVVGIETKETRLNRWAIEKEDSPPLTPTQAGIVKVAGSRVPAEVRDQVEAKATERLRSMAKEGIQPKLQVYDVAAPSTVPRPPRQIPQPSKERSLNR